MIKKIYEVKLRSVDEDDYVKIIEEIVLVAGEDYTDAIHSLEDFYGNDLVSIFIRELETPLVLDEEMIDFWKKQISSREEC